MSKKSSISNVRVVPSRETNADIDIRPGSINIRFRKLTIAEQVAAREGQSHVRVATSKPSSKED